ncbi:mycofactocin precursor MftA [Jatrophihabitans endophyticus]|nr:mycofactocin precursor [Jatrophihabitans endophyticus]
MPEQDPTVDTTTDDVAPQVEDVLVEEVSIDGMCGVY